MPFSISSSASSSVMGFYTAGHMWATLCSTARHSPGRGPYSLRSCRSQRQRACPMVEPCRSLMRSARAGVHPRPPPRAVRVRLGPHALCAQGTAPQSTGSADLPCRRASCPLGGGRGGCRIGRLGRCRLRRSLQPDSHPAKFLIAGAEQFRGRHAHKVIQRSRDRGRQ